MALGLSASALPVSAAGLTWLGAGPAMRCDIACIVAGLRRGTWQRRVGM